MNSILISILLVIVGLVLGFVASFVVNYSPTISMPSGTTKDEFSQLLKRHKDEVVALLKREFERKERLAY